MPSPFIRTDGPLDSHDETNSNLSQFYELAQKQSELNPLSVYEGQVSRHSKIEGDHIQYRTSFENL